MRSGDLVLGKLVDGSFFIGEYFITDSLEPEVVNAYVLMLRQGANGEVGVAIADLYAPFINDAKGVTFQYHTWLSHPVALPEDFKADYIKRRSGIIISKAMPNGGITASGILL